MSRPTATPRSHRNPGKEVTAAAAVAAEPVRLQQEAFSRATSAVVKATGELQQSVVRHTDELQQEAVHQLRLATNPAELMTVHAALLMAGWQHSIQCSTDIANAWFAIGAAGALPPRKPGLN